MSQKTSFNERKRAILNQHHNIINVMRSKKYKTLLDLGCGSAYKSIMFALELDMNVVALDEFDGHGSNEKYEYVQENIKNLSLDHRVHVVQGDAFDIKKLNSYFDVVFTQNVLHHLFPWPRSAEEKPVQEFFRDIYYVINRGGMLCVTDISPWNFWDQLAKFLPGKWYSSSLFSSINSVKYQGKTPSAVWIKHLKKIGFRDLQLEYHVPYPFRKLRFALNNRFANPFIESVYTISAIKPLN